MEDDIEEFSERLSSILIRAESIPKAKGNRRDKVVPWWNEECSNAIKNRNKAYSPGFTDKA